MGYDKSVKKSLESKVNVIFSKDNCRFAAYVLRYLHEYFGDLKRYNEDIEKYNEVAVSIVTKHGFAVNDLYATSVSLPETAHSDPVHYYTPTGTKTFTDQVLSFVLPALEIEEALEYQEDMYTSKPIGM